VGHVRGLAEIVGQKDVTLASISKTESEGDDLPRKVLQFNFFAYSSVLDFVEVLSKHHKRLEEALKNLPSQNQSVLRKMPSVLPRQ